MILVIFILSCINVHVTGKLEHDVNLRIKHVFDTGDTGDFSRIQEEIDRAPARMYHV